MGFRGDVPGGPAVCRVQETHYESWSEYSSRSCSAQKRWDLRLPILCRPVSLEVTITMEITVKNRLSF